MDGEDDVGLKDRSNATCFGGSFSWFPLKGLRVYSVAGDPRASICPEVQLLSLERIGADGFTTKAFGVAGANHF